MLSDDTRRRDFPSLEGRTYLNSAAEGIPPVAVVAALKQYAEDKILGMDGRELHDAQRREAVRQTAIAFGLGEQDVGICSCSSEAFNLAALALQATAQDEIVINDLDFPAAATPWLQPSCPAAVKVWRAREGALRVEDLAPLLGPKTRLLAVSLVSFYNGFRIPLQEVSNTLRKKSSALLALDVTQALGRVPLPLEGVDLFVSSTHKWILAGHGGGLVGVPPHRREQWTVPAGGWYNLENAFENDRFERAVTKSGAASFCVGMPGYAAIYAARAGLEYINSVGVQTIDDHARPLVHACLEGLKELPVEILTHDEDDALAGIVAFRHPDAERIGTALREKNIHVMHHAGRLRVAIHGYNTMQDVETLLRALGECVDAA